jgi:hypothetical protein
LRIATGGLADRLGAALIVILVAGCGSGPRPTASSPVVASAGAPASALVPSASTSPSTSADLPTSSGLFVEVDRGLLDVIPDVGDGLELAYDAETTRQVAADPALAKDAVGLAIALYRVPGAAAPASDLAVISVIRLRDPSIGEEAYRTWRDSYDASACAVAGGVTGNAQSTVNGRVVYIGSCSGGVLTYHVRIRQGSMIVSVTSIGPMRLGEQAMKAIEP